MPTYDYRCPNGHEFEKFYRTISGAADELPCPECGAAATRRLSGGAGLLFKGSGFYLTDYGKNAHRKTGAASGESKSESKSDSSGGESKSGDAAKPASDAKPAAAPASTTKKSDG